MNFKEVKELIDQICDLSRKNIHQRFSIERLPVGYPLEAFMKALKALENPLGFFLYPFKVLKKAVGKFLPNHWKHWKKPLGSFPLPLKALRQAIGKICPTRCYSAVNSLIYGSD